jgi:hypothetical protein
MPTAAAKTFFRIVFSTSESVISSAKVGFVDIADIVASLAKLLLAWSAVFYTVVVGASGPPRVARRRRYCAGLSAKYRGTLSGVYYH